MGYQPQPATAPCPVCKDAPVLRYRLFQGYRAECGCGVCGPFVHPSEGYDVPERRAIQLWAVVAGEPPAPKKPRGRSGVKSG